MVFCGWTLVSGSGNFYSSISPSTTFYINGSNAVVRAMYESAPAPVTYSLSVENGLGSATDLPGDAVVEITANPPAEGQVFTGWTLVSGDGNFYNAGLASTTFYLKNKDAVIRANYGAAE